MSHVDVGLVKRRFLDYFKIDSVLRSFTNGRG